MSRHPPPIIFMASDFIHPLIQSPSEMSFEVGKSVESRTMTLSNSLHTAKSALVCVESHFQSVFLNWRESVWCLAVLGVFNCALRTPKNLGFDIPNSMVENPLKYIATPYIPIIYIYIYFENSTFYLFLGSNFSFAC